MHRRHRRVPAGPRLLEPAEEAQAVETRSAGDFRSCGQRGEDSGDEAVDVEEGHHVQADVARRELQGVDDVPCRSAHVPLQQRDDLRTRGRARSVQHQRHVVASRGAARNGNRAVVERPEREAACAQRRLCNQLQDGKVQGRRHRPSRAVHAGRDQHRLGPQVLQVERQLLGSEPWAERRRGRSGGDADERRGGLRTVGEHHREPVVAPDADRVQVPDGPPRQRAELPIAQRRRAFDRSQGDRIVCAALQQIGDGVQAMAGDHRGIHRIDNERSP